MEGSFCAVCGERLQRGFESAPFAPAGLFTAEEGRLCGGCRTAIPYYSTASAYGSYETGLRDMIHLLKYDRVRPAASVLGSLLANVIARMTPAFGAKAILVVPVPLYSSKLRERGFNQAELVARAAIKRQPDGKRFILRAELLKRRRATESQIGLTQNQRKENLRGAFVVTNPGMVASREILLVDDVLTTGTTVSECARVLRRAGATEVWVATVARTLKKSGQAITDFASVPASVA